MIGTQYHCTGCGQVINGGAIHYCPAMQQYSTHQYPPFSPTNQQLMENLNAITKKLDEILDLLKPGKIVPRGY